MKRYPVDIQRRNILKIGAAGAAAAMAAYSRMAAAQAAQRLDENDPQAQALGYKHDASKVDKAKFKNYQPGQTCANCQQFQGKPKEEWAGCTIFPGKQVNAKGWCSAYIVKKT
jgi:High potential iron-sulfur protein/TAT (twin-arginine translocation) pathway signal sequence